jgi:RNA polymerase sigma-70 factor (ECF subfamily)
LSDTDERLRDRCLAGDERAWQELVSRHLPRVLAFAMGFAGRRQAAEDVAQEIFTRLFRTLGAYDPARGSFEAWLMTMARHVAIDQYRRSREDRLREVPLVTDVASAGDEGPQRVERRQARELVMSGLRALPPELREPVVLCDLQGATYDDAAAALDVPLGTLKSRLNRARLELARRLRGRVGTA